MALEQPVSEDDVRSLYRAILKREAENDEVVRAYTAQGVSAGDAIRTFLNSTEYVERNIPAAVRAIWQAQNAGKVELDATDEQLAAMRRHVEAVWSAYGEEQAYWSVLTAARYRDDRLDQAALDEFFASGVATCDRIVRMLARNGIDPQRIGSVLDFGCGVGRVAAPFARHFGRYIGVDISPGHLRLARERIEASGAGPADFMIVGDFLQSAIGYDFYHSIMVLQHNPPPIMLEMLRAGLSRVRPGGHALFQIPATIFGYAFSAERYLAGDGRRDSMEMHALPQRAVFAELAANGFRLIEVVPDPHIGDAGISYVYLAEKIG